MNEHASTWEAVRGLLRDAASRLPGSTANNGFSDETLGELKGTLHEFEEFLNHNELELAWDALAEVGQKVKADPVFWMALTRAAERMQITEKADQANRAIFNATSNTASQDRMVVK